MKLKFGSVFFVAMVAFFMINASSSFAGVDWNVEKSTVNELQFSLTRPISFDTINNEFGTFLGANDLGAEHSANRPGEPDYLFYNAIFAVPSESGFEVSSVVAEYKPVDFPILPVMKSNIDESGAISKEFAFSAHDYDNTISPTDCQVFFYGIAGDIPLAKARVALFTFNKETKQFMALNSVKINIKFSSKQINTNSKFESNPIVLNNNVAHSFAIPRKQAFANKEKSQFESILSETSNAQVKIKITEEGVYRITASMLSGLGINIASSEVSTIKILGGSGLPMDENPEKAESTTMCEQPIVVRTTNTGELESITFYANAAKGFRGDSVNKHYNNWYGNTNYFFLRWGGDTGLRAVAAENPTGTVANTPNTYIERYFFEENLVNPYQQGSGRMFLGRSIMPATFTTQLNGLDRTGIIKYRLGVAQNSPAVGYFDIYESDTKIVENLSLSSTGQYSSGAYRDVEVTMAANKVAADGRSVLKFDYKPTQVSSSSGFFRFFEIHYPRTLAPTDNNISLFSDANKGLTEYSINGFSGPEIFGWDATNRFAPVLLTNSAVTGGMFIFRKDCNPSAPSHFFVSSKIIQPEIEKIAFVDMRREVAGADAIVVTSPELLASAESYKEYREKNNGIKIQIAVTKDIYNEFGSGIADPAALRNYIRFAYKNWELRPTMLVLWGDGHFDFKNIQTNTINHIPAWQSLEAEDSFYQPASICTDDFYALIMGNDQIIDIGFGRVTVQNNASGNSYIQKIKDYEHASSLDTWRTIAALVADDGPTGQGSVGSNGAEHTNQSERLAGLAPFANFQKKKIYMGAYPVENSSLGRRKPKVNQEIINSSNTQGEMFLNWIGHGSPRVWSDELIFERETTIPQMVNYDKLPVMFSASCDNGRFDMTDVNSLAEELYLSKIGGSIASIASTRLVSSYGNEMLQNELYTQILTRDANTGLFPNLGSALKYTKVKLYDENSRKHVLLGDPLLKMLIPDYQIVVDSINGVDVVNQDTIVPLEGLAKVRISGQVRLPDNSSIDASYNGVLTINMFDADERITATEFDGSVHNFSKNGSALVRTSFAVEKGKFIAEFLLPKDIAFSKQTGRLFLYSFSNDSSRFAMGMNTSFSVVGLNTTAVNPGTGPTMKIYLDSRSFTNRDIVSKNPLLIVDLRDDDGINTTGVGIGHKIEAWIDDSPLPTDLTDKYRNSLFDSKAGSIESVLNGLANGYHSIEVRAWDIFNNPTVGNAEFFIVSDSREIETFDMDNYPNPFDFSTTFRFKHNLTPPFNATIKIYNLAGILVRTLRAELSDLHNSEMPFDGLDDSGKQLAIGFYTYILTLTSSAGVDGTKTGSFIVNR